jgi:hypothetical protein
MPPRRRAAPAENAASPAQPARRKNSQGSQGSQSNTSAGGATGRQRRTRLPGSSDDEEAGDNEAAIQAASSPPSPGASHDQPGFMKDPGRFAHLLKPIRDLADNWAVDVAHELEAYMQEIETLQFSFGQVRARVCLSGATLRGTYCHG